MTPATQAIKPTFESLLGMTNEQLLAMTDTEIDAYLAEALKVRPAPARNFFKESKSESSGGGRINMNERARKGMIPTSKIADELMKSDDKMKYLAEMKEKLLRGESIL